MTRLTNDNYFSPEMQMAYMGTSQFKAFRSCEAAALAELNGSYTRPATTALLVGSYVDAYYEGSLDRFAATHPELFKRDGTLKAEYAAANRIIERLNMSRLYSLLMSGRKQEVRTGEIAGVPFKIKIDSLLGPSEVRTIVQEFPETKDVFGFGEGAIVDQKIMRDTNAVWSDETYSRVPFVEGWGYDLQGAVYQAVEGNMLPFILAVGTKEDEPDVSALYISDADLAAKLIEVEDRAPRYQAIKEGRIRPERCEHCAYCRATRELRRIINYREV